MSGTTTMAALLASSGPLSQASAALTVAATYSGTNFSATPSASAALLSGLQSAGVAIMTAISQAQAALVATQTAANAGDLAANASALLAATGYSQVLSASVQIGEMVNRAAANAALANGEATAPVPVVYAQ